MAVKKWVAKVQTDSTYPEEGLFTKDAEIIAKHLASRKVSPKGPASGMRTLTYFINRGGKGLSEERHAELEKAKHILSGIIANDKTSKATVVKVGSTRKATKKTPARKSPAKKTSLQKPAAKKASKS